MRRLLSVFHARNLEFLRDRGTMLFTLILPIMLVIGMGFVFGGPPRPLFKVGVLGASPDAHSHPFLAERYVQFVPLTEQEEALRKLTHQQFDLLVDFSGGTRYWVNTDSPKGYVVEKLLLAAEPGARAAFSSACTRHRSAPSSSSPRRCSRASPSSCLSRWCCTQASAPSSAFTRPAACRCCSCWRCSAPSP
jgi:hypothetical protein